MNTRMSWKRSMQTQKSRSKPGLTAQTRRSIDLSPLFIAVVAALFSAHPLHAGELHGPYTDSSYFTTVNFGSTSHWLQAWRGYLETVPAHWFLNGVGVAVQSRPNDSATYDMVFQHLSRNGVSITRTEYGWGGIDYETGRMKDRTANKLRIFLAGCRKWHIRPVLLLNAHHGAPCPRYRINRITVTRTAQAGERTVDLESVDRIIPNYSGLHGLPGKKSSKAAGHLITNIAGNTVTLSQPLQETLHKDSTVTITTLKYRPFSDPTGEDYRETVDGWNAYIAELATRAAEFLGTTDAADKGFDMEIWNELTFGSNYLYINWYYDPPLQEYEEKSIWSNLVRETTDFADNHPELFSGVAFNNGFGNTIPWPASSKMPKRIRAIGRHPYPKFRTFPEDRHKRPLNALGKRDSSFTPTYTALFPELQGTWLKTESTLREGAPITNMVYKTAHGRYARPEAPCYSWFTECGFGPGWYDIDNPQRALYLKAKWFSRMYVFYLNKGNEKVVLFSWNHGKEDTDLAVASKAFMDYVESHDTYPAQDESLTSPGLRTVRRITGAMKDDLDTTLTHHTTRPLEVVSIRDDHDHFQWQGDGTPEHPTMYNRECLAILPFQVNQTKFVVPYYVMTRDIRTDLAPEEYTVRLSGIHGLKAHITAYDPIADDSVQVSVTDRSTTDVEITTAAVDYPRLLIIDESDDTRVSPAHGSSPHPVNLITVSPVPGGLLIRGAGHGPTTIQILDCRGRIIARKTRITQYPTVLPTGRSAEGVYIVRITSTTTTFVRRFLMRKN